MAYRCEAATIEGFIQQLAVSYVPHGYWFYVTGIIPGGKDLSAVDTKLLAKYGIDRSRWTRARRKAAGLANLHYLRHGRFFALLATHGKHAFFEEESVSIRDLRETPLKFASYAVSYRGGHASVRIEAGTFKDLKAYFLELATKRNASWFEAAFRKLPFEPYAPVRSQLLTLLRAVNRKRKIAACEPVSASCLRLRRRIVKPFSDTASPALQPERL